MNLDSALRSEWRAGIYCRLSKDDELQGESASISNQRELLRGYCRGQGWEIVAEFEDDGYTGLNMDRPGLRKLLDAVKDRRINMVLTKDLSRLGRNYLETGQLMDMFFPKHGVRYIAINDGIDTDADSNDIAPHKLWKRMHEVNDEISLFAGLIKCGECGKALTVRYTNAKNPVKIYACVTYNKFGKQHCTQHRIDYDFLYQLVLSKIREAAQAAIGDGDEIVQRMVDARTAEAASEKEMHKRNIQKAEARLAVIDKMIAKLYEDLIEEKIETATFDRLLQKAQSEQVSLNGQIRSAQAILEDEAKIDENAQAWIEEIRQYADITELDRETLHRLVKEIIVHEEIDADRHRNITVEIHFNFKAIPEISGTDIHVETS